jgi:hypothetical protein
MSAPDDPAAMSSPAPEAITPEPPADGIQAEPDSVPIPPPPAEPVFASTERFLFWRRVLDGTLVAVVLLLAFEIGFFPVRNSDLLMHRAVGRLVATHQFDFQTDPFTYASEGARWIDHSWLFGLFVYGMNQMGDWGDGALIALKALLLAALAELMLRVGRRPGRSLWIPTLCVGLAILALSPWALLRPACVSFLFLGLTLYLLDAPRRRHDAIPEKPFRFWNVRWLIPLVCALWVNLDAWFILGPALVGLYLLGEWLEGSEVPRGSIANLGAVLIVSVVACLANPYHVYAFQLPDHLGFSPAGQELERVAPFSYLFLSPVRNAGEFLRIFDAARSVAGLTYYPLVFLGLASFILAPGSWRSWRGTVWAGMWLLGAWHGEAVPFFCIVAGPIMAINFLQIMAVQADLPDDADQRRRVLIVRTLTVLLGIAAFTAGSAGWLHAPVWGATLVSDSRRPGWWLDFDDALKNAALQVAEWREKKVVPEDARWFNASTNAANYFAWYAPGARVYLDTRLSLYPADAARDYHAALESLNSVRRPADDTVEETEHEQEWTRVLRDRKIDFVVLGERDLSRGVPLLLRRLVNQSKDWTMCYLFGGSAIFGWNGAARAPEEYQPIRYDSQLLAFGPDALTAPAKRPIPPPDPEWWQIVWQPERKRSTEADNAVIHMMAYDAQSNRRVEEEMREAIARLAGAPLGALINGGAADYWLFAMSAIHDPGPPADLYLAVRAARRALDENSEDGRAWFRLGQAYTALAFLTRERNINAMVTPARELRRVQTIVALNRAVRLNPELEAAHGLLAEQYQNVFVDLTLEHREAQLKLMMAQLSGLAARGESGPDFETAKNNMQGLQNEVQRLLGLKKQLEDQFELTSANKLPAQRAEIARQHRLGDAALKAAREHLQQMKDGSAEPGTVAPGMELAIRLLIDMGEIDEARVLVEGGGRDMLSQSRDPSLPVAPQDAGDWYRVLIDAASGDYADADATLEDLAKRTGDFRPGPGIAAALGEHLLWKAAEAGNVAGLASRLTRPSRQAGRAADGIPSLDRAMQISLMRLGRAADCETLRGWLALESGDIKTAKHEMSDVKERAAKPNAMLNAYRCGPLADVALEWIEAAGHH